MGQLGYRAARPRARHPTASATETAWRNVARSTGEIRLHDEDLAFLRRAERPGYEEGDDPLRLVDLFAGCGGLTLGFAEGARRAGSGIAVPLALDSDVDAVAVYRANFPGSGISGEPVEALFGGVLGDEPTPSEVELAAATGAVDVVLAGPPCQGHSDLNNHTRRDDPRNALYTRVVRAVEILAPDTVVIENVPGVIHDRRSVVTVATTQLGRLGYRVASSTIRLSGLGVPQERKRHLLIATRDVDPSPALAGLGSPAEKRDVRWAIGDLARMTDRTGLDRASVLSDDNRERAEWLIENREYDLPNPLRPACHQDDGHTYKSMYGRLRWDEPAQTVTTGYGSPGQGRYLHPEAVRTITPHEAARLQTFPDFFSFDAVSRRGSWARMIGNAVPPLVGVRLCAALLRASEVEPGEPKEALAEVA